jgi:hypothetical protein
LAPERNQAASTCEGNGIETHDKVRENQKETMRRLANRLFCILMFGTTVFSATVSEQGRVQSPSPASATADVQPPNPKGSDPRPEDAMKALLAAFDRYEVVGMSAAHGNQDLDNFILDFLRNAALPGRINDVAVECGNSLYQPILDRYIAGDDVPLAEVRQLWRNTTQPMCGTSGFYEQLFPLVRRINQRLSPDKRLRVLACDPPIDWGKVKSQQDFMQFMMRDLSIASVMEKEVLAKHRKALMLFGTGHLFHGDLAMGPTAVGRYEKDYPGVTLVVADHRGFGSWTPLAKYNNELEVRMASWPVPSLVQQMKGSWLADLLDSTYSTGVISVVTKLGKDGKPVTSYSDPLEKGNKFSTKVDAYLYLGPRDLLLQAPRPAEVLLDRDYMAEMQRRAAVMGGGPRTGASDRDYNPFLYDPEEMKSIIGGKQDNR